MIHEGAAVYDEARHDDGGDDELELGGLRAGVAPPLPEQADHDRVELVHPLAWKLNAVFADGPVRTGPMVPKLGLVPNLGPVPRPVL